MELLTKLGVDLGTIVAQIVNVALLTGVLSVFLYKPLLRVIDERAERTKKAMEDAKRSEEHARDLERVRAEKLRQMDEEYGRLVSEAKGKADGLRLELIAKAEQEALRLLERAREEIKMERRAALEELKGTAAKLVVSLTGKLLAREFSAADQKRIIADIEKQLPTLIE